MEANLVFLLTTAVVLVFAVVLMAYVPWPVPPASGSSIYVPSRWHNGRVERLRVATYNIHRGRGVDGRRDLGRIGDVIRGSDVVALQEVGAAVWPRGSQVQRLGTQLDMGWLYMPARYRWFHQDRGNGLLSVFPVNHWNRSILPGSARRTPRTLTSARLLVDGRELWLLITHLNTRNGRHAQLDVVLDRFRHYSPAILLGDLNTPRDDPVLSQYLAQEPVIDALGQALGANDPGDRVDWVLTRGMQVVDGGVEASAASDHPYYWVDLRFP